jgi:DNA-binding ferritin-like protein
MREKFYESLTAQSDLMDKLAERLLTLEPAIPGLYATVLKLVSGEKATAILNAAFYVTFACWLAALIVTLVALTPKKWVVDH